MNECTFEKSPAANRYKATRTPLLCRIDHRLK